MLCQAGETGTALPTDKFVRRGVGMSSPNESPSSFSSERPEMFSPPRALVRLPLGMGTLIVAEPRSVGRRRRMGGGGGARVNLDGGRVARRREGVSGVPLGTFPFDADACRAGGDESLDGVKEICVVDVKTSSSCLTVSCSSRRSGEDAKEDRRLE